MEWIHVDLSVLYSTYLKSCFSLCLPECITNEILSFTDCSKIKAISFSSIGIRFRHDLRWFYEFEITKTKEIRSCPEECTFYYQCPYRQVYKRVSLWDVVGCKDGEEQRRIHTELFSQSSLGTFTCILQKYLQRQSIASFQLECLSLHLEAFAVLVLQESCFSYRQWQLGDIAAVHRTFEPSWGSASVILDTPTNDYMISL